MDDTAEPWVWEPPDEHLRERMASLYAESGGDVTRCEICDQPLDDENPWKRGLDGAGAHIGCLRAMGVKA